MASKTISTDHIFANIFNISHQNDNAILQNLENVDDIIIKNETTHDKRVIKSIVNFEKLIKVMSNDRTASGGDLKCDEAHDEVKILPHDWCVKGNYFFINVKPFLKVDVYKAIGDDINFDVFFQSNRNNYGNERVRSGEYYYWPNVNISYFGWRLYLYIKFNVDIGEYIPLVFNEHLGNVNLFIFNPEYCLNVELSMTCENKKLFVNGRSRFDDSDDDDDLFHLIMTNGSKGVCKVKPNLIFSNKNFFDYLRDDINLCECTTVPKYQKLIRVDLKDLRVFKENEEIVEMPSNKTSSDCMEYEALKVFNNITPSSEHIDIIQDHVKKCLDTINENMIAAMATNESVGDDVLRDYLVKSDFVNFDFLILVIWRTISKQEELDLRETDIKLFLELLCETLFPDRSDFNYRRAQLRCEPYYTLTYRVFVRFCNHWSIFLAENSCVTLGNFYAIHYMIHMMLCKEMADPKECWEYNYENAMRCGASPDVLCRGYFKKIYSNNTCLIFNGKHYVALKKDDELFKFTEKQTGIMLSTVKFNNWKYLYFTEEGLYNLFINKYHNSCPFILGNTLMGALVKKHENLYLPERTIQFMLDNGKNEVDIYKTYHGAKVCRDFKKIKTNMSIVMAFNNCDVCKTNQQIDLNNIYREVWNFTERELMIVAVYLKERKITDLITNLRCDDCKYTNKYTNCSCLESLKVNKMMFKLVIMFELLCNSRELCELMWSLLYDQLLYVKILEDLHAENELIQKYSRQFYANRDRIVTILYRRFDRVNCVDKLIETLNYEPANFIEELIYEATDGKSGGEHDRNDDDDDYDEIVGGNDGSDDCDKNDFHMFYHNYVHVVKILKQWNVWWDKLIVMRHNDDLMSWLTRFYMRAIMSKVDLKEYSTAFVKNVVIGYLYFRVFTNFNYTNSLLMMFFAASLGIPSDYEKCCIYLIGEPGSGKSSFFELLEHIVVVHKHDAEHYTLSKKETDEMEANKLISQLYVINEMKVCNDSFFKSTADSTKSNSVCRKYQGSQKYEANYKLMIVNNKPLYVSDYDKGVRNRFAVVYTDHKFEENMLFDGSIYAHIKSKKFPMEKAHIEGMIKPVRLFASHILMYKRNTRDGYVSYKSIVKKDPIHRFNLMCMDVNNSAFSALMYVLNVKISQSAKLVDENKIIKAIEAAAPVVETLLHDMMKVKRNSRGKPTEYDLNHRIPDLCVEFRKTFKKYYRPHDNVYYNIELALDKKDFVTEKPTFKC